MTTDDRFRASRTLDDLRAALIEARKEAPRVLDFNAHQREMFQAAREVRAHYKLDAQIVAQEFACKHPGIMLMAEASNHASNPEFVLAVARVLGGAGQ